MIDLTKVRNFYIACGYTDLRLGIDGLAAVVKQQYGSHFDEESLFLFCGRRTDRIKALYWCGDTYSMIPPTEDVVSSYSVDVTKDNGKTVHIGDYSTVEELDKAISDAVKNGQLTQEEADSVQK